MFRAVLAAAILTSLAISLPAAVEARVPEGQRVMIDDPLFLQHLGYAGDADNVFLWVPPEGVPTDRESAPGLILKGVLVPANLYTSASGFAFQPISDATAYLKGPSFLVFNGALTRGTNGAAFEAQLDLPSGASGRWVDIFGSHDHSTEPLIVTVLERCLPDDVGGNPSETVLATATIFDQNGSFWLSRSISGLVPDNALCTYHVRAIFGDGTGTAPGILIQLSKVRAELAP